MQIDEFLRWFQKEKIDVKNVEIRYENSSGFGLYSKGCFVEKDFLLLSIPRRLFIEPSNDLSQFSGFEQLIQSLVNECSSHPYLKFLRSLDPIPSWKRFSPEDFPEFLQEKMKKHLHKYFLSREKFAHIDDELFEKAYYLVNTRSFHFNRQTKDKDEDNNLCLIPFLGQFFSSFSLRFIGFCLIDLDLINHSIHPNSKAQFNSSTNSYELRTIKRIQSENEQITFLYNPHSNIDLFIEYGFVLHQNPFNSIDIHSQIQQILSPQQVELFKSLNYWQTLQFYAGDGDLSWTIVKAIELTLDEEHWSPHDDPSNHLTQRIHQQLKHLFNRVQLHIEQDQQQQQWTIEQFQQENETFKNDSTKILVDTLNVIDRYRS